MQSEATDRIIRLMTNPTLYNECLSPRNFQLMRPAGLLRVLCFAGRQLCCNMTFLKGSSVAEASQHFQSVFNRSEIAVFEDSECYLPSIVCLNYELFLPGFGTIS